MASPRHCDPQGTKEPHLLCPLLRETRPHPRLVTQNDPISSQIGELRSRPAPRETAAPPPVS